MNLETITRNAENQVAAALKNKVDRFIASKKKDRRLELLLDINNLAQDLTQITCSKPDLSLMEKKPLAPLPAREVRTNLADELIKIATPLSESELAKLNSKIKGTGCPNYPDDNF
jgi:hypothetical protein